MSKRQEEIERELVRQRKAKLMRDLENDLQYYHNKKNEEAQAKKDEIRDNESLLNEETFRFHSPYMQYRNKINEMNKRIYDRSKMYNGYLNSPLNNEFFNAKDDFEFNKKVAEQKEREKYLMRTDQTKINLRQEEAKRLKEEDQRLKSEKIKSQNNYKEYLDIQNIERNNKALEKRNQSQGEQLIMPSYNYPNYPLPVTKKAFDPLHLNNTSPALNSNKNKYLGESQLRHNPITCPIDDVEYNKYVLNDLLYMNNSNHIERNVNGIDNILTNTGNRIMALNSQ